LPGLFPFSLVYWLPSSGLGTSRAAAVDGGGLGLMSMIFTG